MSWDHQSLLDLIAIQMGCDYLSDLRYLSRDRQLYLAEKLKNLHARESALRDWNAALAYLTPDSTPRSSAEEARAALITWLSAPNHSPLGYRSMKKERKTMQ